MPADPSNYISQMLSYLPPQVREGILRRNPQIGGAWNMSSGGLPAAGAPGESGPGAPGKPAWAQLQEMGIQPTGTPAGNRAALAEALAKQGAYGSGGSSGVMPVVNPKTGQEIPPYGGGTTLTAPAVNGGMSFGMEPGGGTSISTMGDEPGGGNTLSRGPARFPRGLADFIQGPPPELMERWRGGGGGMGGGMAGAGGMGGATSPTTSAKPWVNPELQNPDATPMAKGGVMMPVRSSPLVPGSDRPVTPDMISTPMPKPKPVNSNAFAQAGQDTQARPLPRKGPLPAGQSTTRPPVRRPQPGSQAARAQRFVRQ